MGQAPDKAERRDEVAAAFFAFWVVGGLFLDGWAHNADMVETFWTPWHAVLYSGFAAGGLYAAFSSLRARGQGLPLLRDPLIGAGFLAFLIGGVADGAWHTVFGVEEDLEALLSPTHLMLMIGGLLLTTSTLRTAWARAETAPTGRTFAPAAVGTTLAIAIVAFFLQFASPFRPEAETFRAGAVEDSVAVGVLAFMITTALLLGATFIIQRRWRLPRHTLLFVYTGVALMMTGLHGFREVWLVLPAALGGALADALSRGPGRTRLLGMLVPSVMWLSWFAIYATIAELGWTPELWIGSTVFSALTGLGLSYLFVPPLRGSAADPAAVRDTAASSP